DDRVLSLALDNTVKTWDLDGGHLLASVHTPEEVSLETLARLADGRLLTGVRDGALQLWSPDSDKIAPWGTEPSAADWRSPASLWREHTQTQAATPAVSSDLIPILAAATLADGRIATASPRGDIDLWSPSGAWLTALSGHDRAVRALLTLPGGRLASASDDRTLRIWDLERGIALATLRGHEGWIRALALLPDGRIASASDDSTIRIWDPAGLRRPAALRGHEGWIRALAITGDGHLISGSSDRTLRVWDPGRGRCIATLYGNAAFTCLAAEGSRVVAGDAAHDLWFLDWSRVEIS
ncbi:MAG: WD40 repeat domain-containing protein, partial [Myxococcales bacterium]|nr:WD40 repeat domain-containing protein [Myxococcales bacterium]